MQREPMANTVPSSRPAALPPTLPISAPGAHFVTSNLSDANARSTWSSSLHGPTKDLDVNLAGTAHCFGPRPGVVIASPEPCGSSSMTTSIILIFQNPTIPPSLIREAQSKLAYLDEAITAAHVSDNGHEIELVLRGSVDDAHEMRIRENVKVLVRLLCDGGFQLQL